jgi:hypothetical protein
MKRFFASTTTLVLVLLLSFESFGQRQTQVVKKSDIKTRQYVVMLPATDTIFGKIVELSFENHRLSKLVIQPEGGKKKMNLSTEQLQAVVGLSFFRPTELVQIKDEQGIKRDTWLNVLNTGSIRLYQQKEKVLYGDEDLNETMEVVETVYYWKFDEQVFEVTYELMTDLILPIMKECGAAEAGWDGSLKHDELVRINALLNQWSDCFSFASLN